MRLRIKFFDILGVHWKIRRLGGGEFMRNQYREGECLKRGAWIVCRFKGGLGKKEGGWCFWVRGGGGWFIPRCTLCMMASFQRYDCTAIVCIWVSVIKELNYRLDHIHILEFIPFHVTSFLCSIKKVVFKNFAIFIGKHLCYSFF